MIASNVDAGTLRYAASALGFALDMRPLNAKGTRHRVKVNLGRVYATPECALTRYGNRRKGQPGAYRYQRLGRRGDTHRIFAVCWHGFRDYFREVFKVAPNAVFATSLDTWRGAADFEARFESSATHNIRSMFAPLCIADACYCER
jgi:hypothetical protein